MLCREEIILDNQLRKMGTSLYEICCKAGVPVDESEFMGVDTSLVASSYERIVEEAVKKLDIDLDEVTKPFWSSSCIGRPVFTYEKMFGGEG